MDYDGLINKYLGKPIDYDGVYGAQCVDLIKQYLHDCFGLDPGAWGNAKDYFLNTNPAILAKFDRIANDPKDFNQVPKRGDIVIFSGDQPGSGGYGHINIYDMKTGAGRWQGLDQNWGGQTVHFVPDHKWTYVLGWLTPKVAPVAPAPTPVVVPQPVSVPAPVVVPIVTLTPEPPAPTPIPETPIEKPVVASVEVSAPVLVDKPVEVAKPDVSKQSGLLILIIQLIVKLIKNIRRS